MIVFSVDEKIAQKFAGLTIGVVEGECAENKLADEEAFAQEKTAVEVAAQNVQSIAGHPNIIAWRKAFHAFDADPTKTRSSGEALLRRVQRGDRLPRINAIVDVYNLVSLKHVLPVGGQDEEKVVGGVRLRLAGKNENFVPLGASQPEQVDEGEVVYADDEKILCSKWNYRDCEPAKISEATRKFVLFVDGAPGVAHDEVRAAAEELAQALKRFVVGCTARADRLVGVD